MIISTSNHSTLKLHFNNHESTKLHIVLIIAIPGYSFLSSLPIQFRNPAQID